MKYVVLFDRLGFYAKKHPHDRWAFTSHLDEAKQYTSKSGATNRIHAAPYAIASQVLGQKTGLDVETINRRYGGHVIELLTGNGFPPRLGSEIWE